MSVGDKMIYFLFSLTFSASACWVDKQVGKQMQAEIIALKTQFGAIREVYAKEKVALQQRIDKAAQRVQELSELISEYKRSTARNAADFSVEIERLKRRVIELRGQTEVNQHLLGQVEQRLSSYSSDLSIKNSEDQTHGRNSKEEKLASIQRPEKQADFYKLAYDLFMVKQYKAGRILFEEFLEKWPVGEYSDNALYWIAESYYEEGEYRKAALSFQRLRMQFSESDKLEDALLKLGLCFYSMKMYRESLPFLKKFIKEYPQNRLIRVARKKMKEVQNKMQ